MASKEQIDAMSEEIFGTDKPTQSDAPNAEESAKVLCDELDQYIIQYNGPDPELSSDAVGIVTAALKAYAALRTARQEKEIREELAKYTNMHDAETVIGGNKGERWKSSKKK